MSYSCWALQRLAKITQSEVNSVFVWVYFQSNLVHYCVVKAA